MIFKLILSFSLIGFLLQPVPQSIDPVYIKRNCSDGSIKEDKQHKKTEK